MEKEFRVGELSKLTGLTVRTLHYYEEMGLFSPTQRAANSYRLYSEADVAVLQRISTLKFLGFSLEQIKSFLKAAEDSPAASKSSLVKLIPLQIKKSNRILLTKKF